MLSVKTQYNYKLIDLSTKIEYEEQINSDDTLGDLLNSLKLRENCCMPTRTICRKLMTNNSLLSKK